MKTYLPIIAVLLATAVVQAQPTPNPPAPGAPAAVAAREPVNYLIRVEWKEPKSDPRFLEVLTTEGKVELDTIQKTAVKINGNDIPVTLRLTGTLTPLDGEKGRLQLFLGRTVPYVTGTTSGGIGMQSSYSQMNVGLESTFIVTFGKPVVIQNDESGEISVLVKRLKS